MTCFPFSWGTWHVCCFCFVTFLQCGLWKDTDRGTDESWGISTIWRSFFRDCTQTYSPMFRFLGLDSEAAWLGSSAAAVSRWSHPLSRFQIHHPGSTVAQTTKVDSETSGKWRFRWSLNDGLSWSINQPTTKPFTIFDSQSWFNIMVNWWLHWSTMMSKTTMGCQASIHDYPLVIVHLEVQLITIFNG